MTETSTRRENADDHEKVVFEESWFAKEKFKRSELPDHIGDLLHNTCDITGRL